MKKPLKVAAWSGVVVLVALFVFTFLLFIYGDGDLGSLTSLAANIVLGAFGSLFFYGYVTLGKKYNKGLLKVMSWIGFVFSLLLLIGGILGYVFGNSGTEGVNTIIWALIAIILGIVTILFGFGVKGLGSEVKYSKTVGILNIIAGVTYIVFVGFLVKLVAYVFEIALMFKSARGDEAVKRPMPVQVARPVARRPNVRRPINNRMRPRSKPIVRRMND